MAQVQEQQAVNITINDLIYAQVKDLGNRMDRLEKGLDVTRTELNARMDRIERRQDKLEEKLETTRKEVTARMDKQDAKIDKLDEKVNETRKELNGRIDKLSDKIDDLHKEIKSSSNPGQIATISSVGIGLSAVSITLGVLYALIFK